MWMTNKGRIGIGPLPEAPCQTAPCPIRQRRAPVIVSEVEAKLSSWATELDTHSGGSPEKSLPGSSTSNDPIALLFKPARYTRQGRYTTRGHYHTGSGIKGASIISFEVEFSANERGFGGVAQESNNIQALRGPSKYSGSLWWQVGARDLAEIQRALEQASSLHPPAVQLHTLGLHTTF